MAVITLVNNINVISGSLTLGADPHYTNLNQGAFAILTSSTQNGYTDISSSFQDVQTMWSLPSSSFMAFLSGGYYVDISASFDVDMWKLTSGSFTEFILSQPFPETTIFGAGSTIYIIRGFYTGSGQYEYWTSPARDSAPPTTHTLIEVTVIGEIVGGAS